MQLKASYIGIITKNYAEYARYGNGRRQISKNISELPKKTFDFHKNCKFKFLVHVVATTVAT